VVNLGWSDNSPGLNGLINGLYVVKTDWFTPTAKERTWVVQDTNTVAHQNNAVIASMMVPGTQFGTPLKSASLYENIFVEDPPQVLFSLKIVPPRDNANTESLNLSAASTLNLYIQNVFSPPSTVKNSIGFDILGKDYTFPTGCVPGSSGCQSYNHFTLKGSMNVSLENVFIVNGSTATALTELNAPSLGKVVRHGGDVSVTYNPVSTPPKLPPPPLCKQYTCM
jgi:hypothetical protein